MDLGLLEYTIGREPIVVFLDSLNVTPTEIYF